MSVVTRSRATSVDVPDTLATHPPNRGMGWAGRTFPHPPGRRRWWGDAFAKGTDPTTPTQNMLAAGRRLGPVFEMLALGRKFVFVAGVDLAGELCDDTRFTKALAPAVQDLRLFVGDGLFTARSDEPNWRLAHELLVPAFAKPAMRRYHDVMVEATDELIGVWDEAASSGRTVDVSPWLTKLTLETIGRSAFSHTFASFGTEEVDPFVRTFVADMSHAAGRSTTASLPLVGRHLVRRKDRRALARHRHIDDLLRRIVADREAKGDESDDLLGRMMHVPVDDSGTLLEAQNVRHQILTMLVAGHETTSGALSFALYHLTREPQVLARVRAELDEVLGSDPLVSPTFEQVPKLRYLRRVVDETLRLWPTAPGFARTPRGTTTIGADGSAGVPGGLRMTPQDSALVFIPLLHRDPDVWPDPDRFDPDRFLPQHNRARPAHAYKPFGTGERACIGRQFALHEAVIVLAKLLHRFDLTPEPDYELTITERLTLMPVGFRVGLTRR
ncbi:cytochrome P450 [Janibacter sp. GS2]|uniref:cytochrome P450 n=1 Tax=Janibacter sp. GS2 TaxID=3442646 RepID=UPI003EBE9094